MVPASQCNLFGLHDVLYQQPPGYRFLKVSKMLIFDNRWAPKTLDELSDLTIQEDECSDPDCPDRTDWEQGSRIGSVADLRQAGAHALGHCSLVTTFAANRFRDTTLCSCSHMRVLYDEMRETLHNAAQKALDNIVNDRGVLQVVTCIANAPVARHLHPTAEGERPTVQGFGTPDSGHLFSSVTVIEVLLFEILAVNATYKVPVSTIKYYGALVQPDFATCLDSEQIPYEIDTAMDLNCLSIPDIAVERAKVETLLEHSEGAKFLRMATIATCVEASDIKNEAMTLYLVLEQLRPDFAALGIYLVTCIREGSRISCESEHSIGTLSVSFSVREGDKVPKVIMKGNADQTPRLCIIAALVNNIYENVITVFENDCEEACNTIDLQERLYLQSVSLSTTDGALFRGSVCLLGVKAMIMSGRTKVEVRRSRVYGEARRSGMVLFEERDDEKKHLLEMTNTKGFSLTPEELVVYGSGSVVRNCTIDRHFGTFGLDSVGLLTQMNVAGVYVGNSKEVSSAWDLETLDKIREAKLLDLSGKVFGTLTIRRREFVFKRRPGIKSVFIKFVKSFRSLSVAGVGLGLEVDVESWERDPEEMIDHVLSMSMGQKAARWVFAKLLSDRVDVSESRPSYLCHLPAKGAGITILSFVPPALTEGLKAYVCVDVGVNRLVIDRLGKGKPIEVLSRKRSSVFTCAPYSGPADRSLFGYIVDGIYLGA